VRLESAEEEDVHLALPLLQLLETFLELVEGTGDAVLERFYIALKRGFGLGFCLEPEVVVQNGSASFFEELDALLLAL
jgi:hypothetical protein